MSVVAPDAIGIFGGTFDPVHFGHLRAALEVKEQLGLCQMRLLPSARPPHRVAPVASAEHRLAMLNLALQDFPDLVADDRELHREGPSWMVDTLQSLRDEFGSRPLLLVIGQDAANGLDRWHQWRQLFKLAHLVVMQRPDAQARYSADLDRELSRRAANDSSQLLESPAGQVWPVAITQLEISASAIREMFAGGRSPDFLLPQKVIEFVRFNGLY